jgi:flagellar hook-associated protein 3 FlgL
MRVSTSQIYDIATISMRNSQNAVIKTQEQIATGKRILTPADDPVAATTILQIKEELARTQQYNKNIDIAENNLALEETTLKGVMTLVQRMQELAVAAGNTAVMTSADYQALAAEVESRIQELTSLQNTRNASGQYIFSGYQGDVQPFTVDGAGQVTYHGDEGQLRLQASSTVTVAVSDSGRRLFMDIPSAHNTFVTSAAASNRAAPPASISIGQVYDQDAFDAFFPENLVITFNDPNSVSPPGSNFTVSERGTGRQLLVNQPYTTGQAIEVAGIRFSITGAPTSPAAANLPFSPAAAVDFSLAPASVTVTVGGVSETLILDRNVTSSADLLAALGSSVDTVVGSGASENANKLARLGLVLDPVRGLVSPNGANVTLRNGSAAVDTVTGLSTQGAGVTSTNGRAGDSFFVNSTNKEPLLGTLSRFAQAMREVKDTPESKKELAEIVARTLANLTNAVTRISSVQGEIGARQNTLESARDLNLDTDLFSKRVLGQLEDLDVAEASTRLAMESFVLSAAQQSFVKVSQLTLFNFI